MRSQSTKALEKKSVFEVPEAEIVLFSRADSVLTLSGNNDDDGNQGEWDNI